MIDRDSSTYRYLSALRRLIIIAIRGRRRRGLRRLSLGAHSALCTRSRKDQADNNRSSTSPSPRPHKAMMLKLRATTLSSRSYKRYCDACFCGWEGVRLFGIRSWLCMRDDTFGVKRDGSIPIDRSMTGRVLQGEQKRRAFNRLHRQCHEIPVISGTSQSLCFCKAH